MSRNILLSFAIHILLLVMTGILYAMGNHPIFIIIVLLVLVLFGYSALGNVFFRPMKSVVVNLL